MLKVKRNGEYLGIWAFEKLGSRISRLGTESWPTTETAIIECKGSHSNRKPPNVFRLRGATQLVEWEGKSAAFFTFDTPARYKRHVHTYCCYLEVGIAE